VTNKSRYTGPIEATFAEPGEDTLHEDLWDRGTTGDANCLNAAQHACINLAKNGRARAIRFTTLAAMCEASIASPVTGLSAFSPGRIVRLESVQAQ
jgi:hypothetical protein